MFDEEPRPKPAQRFNLRIYIADLTAEIARAEAAIAARSNQKAAADAFFKRSP